MIDLYLIFQFVKGRCHGNKIMFFARLPDCSTVLFRYYLLGGDTAAPSGLFARLCHAYLVFDKSTEYISAYTGPIFTIFYHMKDICVNFLVHCVEIL